MNLQTTLKTLVTFGATWVLWLLVGLSVLALSVILERLVFFWRIRVDADELRSELKRSFAARGFDDLAHFLRSGASPEAHIVGAGLAARSAPEAEQLMVAEAQLQRLRSEKSLAFLGTLGNNAPFIGLLGTVLGIVGAFQQLDQARGQVTAGLMTQIGEALVSTAVGLLVALPAVATYNAFQRAIQVRLQRGDALGRELIAHLHRLTPSSDASVPASGPKLVAGE